MRTLPFIGLLLLLLSCGPTPKDTDTNKPANAAVATEQKTPSVGTPAETEAPSPVVASPRPQTVAIETQATPNAKPRPATPPSVTLKETAQQSLPTQKSEQKITVTEEAPSPKSTESAPSPQVVEAAPPPPPAKTQPDHSGWDSFLQSNVSSSGQVNYRNIKADPAGLNNYLDELEAYPPQKDWTRNAIMAYWINAYNAYTVKLIINNYPVSSIKDIDGGNPWATKWIIIGGQTYSLNQIENDILRARYGDARIHFAVNCAAASCPPLHNRAFTTDNLNGTLQRLTRKFINNESYNTISAQRIEVSKIFDWYASDFGSVVDYINGYTDTSLDSNTAVAYKEYDWALNGR